MSDVKQVKVDNWGIYFLQRLKHFFNRTDYCDLTLQFQDNAQLKVHRLVLNVCTEYFELLERTCEMYEDCLVMPDDLQADVVVPIVNFMYTGQLEFKKNSLDKLYQTSQVMNMPVLTKLLEAHRGSQPKLAPSLSYGGMKKTVKSIDAVKPTRYSAPTPSSSGKRSYNKAFESSKSLSKPKVVETNRPSISSHNTSEITKNTVMSHVKTPSKEKKYSTSVSNGRSLRPPSPVPLDAELYSKKYNFGDPRPTRYELPEELDTDNIFENSFSNISYTSKPLMIHPETTIEYSAKKKNLYSEASTSKKIMRGSTVDIVECKKIAKSERFYDIDPIQSIHDDEMFQPAYISVKDGTGRDPSQLFDQILDDNESPKLTIEGKDKHSSNLDHAKIISEVLKKYPHLVKGNKNIKLKILNTSNKAKKTRPPTPLIEEKFDVIQPKSETCYTYETDVLDSKEAAKLIAMGAGNIKGPWICLICGTPGRALNFTSYYNFRRHLVEVHNEKPVSTICEYCGLRSYKRNYLLHHIYTKHGVPPPPQYHFPKCNMCNYVALTEGFLVKHKLTHSEFKPLRCCVCACAFSSPSQLLQHVQKTGHKVNTNKKDNLQCVYCMKVFLRESNFYVHLKTNHKEAAIRDGRLIEDSDEERPIEEKPKVSHDMVKSNVKYEHSTFENEYDDTESQFSICQRSDSNTHITKKARVSTPNMKHKILNPGFTSPVKTIAKQKITSNVNSEYVQHNDNPSPQTNEENVIIIDGNEYVMKYNQLIPKKYSSKDSENYIIPEFTEHETDPKLQSIETKFAPSTSVEFIDSEKAIQQPNMVVKKSTENQPIQIVVSNEEEYKALMSSNHSIIFDDGNTNKTLTVLTTPHTPVDNSAIDIENNQSNEMMIIQEDYSLNESVSGDSKYVVVYSHDDHSKQYQIITPHEIPAEYVQDSEVITENYENITTSTSVLNNQVIQAQIEQSWPEHITDGQATVQLLPNKNMEAIEQSGTDTNTTNIDPAEVEVTSVTADVPNDMVTLEQIESGVTESNAIILENIQADKQIIEEIQNNQTEPMDVDVSTDVNTEKESGLSEETQSDMTEAVIVNPNEEALLNVNITTEDGISGTTINDNEQLNEIENTDQLSTDMIGENNIQALSDITEIVPVNNDSDNVVAKVATDQIQNITSEWSEDEYETNLEKSTSEKSVPENQTSPRDESEIEESIENIQQEMQKQIACENERMVIEDSANSQETPLSATENNSENNQITVSVANVEGAQEKISSLLNDWEDNDSQEDNGSQEGNISPNKNGDVQEATGSAEPSKVEVKEMEVSNKVDPRKDDNIKNLVSDWDDDEEEEISQ